MNFNYPVENGASSPISFPATIQGNGANVYVIGVQADSSYIFLDLDTHACTTHYADMLDGYAFTQYVHVGGGSTGSIVNVTGAGGAFTTATWLTMGNCTETVDSCFVYGVLSLLDCITESSKGPNLTAIMIAQDGSTSGITLASAAASTINIIQTSCCDWAQGTASNDDYAASSGLPSRSRSARNTASGVSGNSVSRTPTASSMALAMAGDSGMVADSPTPLAPNGALL